MTFLYLLFLLPTVLCSTEIFYASHVDNDEMLNGCVSDAIGLIESETCLHLTHDVAADNLAFSVLPATECKWQPSNRSMHLASSCASKDTCLEMIAAALGVNQPHHNAIHHINTRFNCSGDCGIECLHGGTPDRDSCTCKCSYPFDGPRCDGLAKHAFFKDSSCGVIDAEDQGSVSLSTYPGEQEEAVFCQWHIKTDDPWDTIELSFDELDMDANDLPAGQTCNDILIVYGAGDSKMISCDGSMVNTMTSSSNWVVLEYRSFPWGEKARAGPSIRYTVHRRKHAMMGRTEEMTASASVFSSLLLFVVPFIF